jgi:hypothetical protein
MDAGLECAGMTNTPVEARIAHAGLMNTGLRHDGDHPRHSFAALPHILITIIRIGSRLVEGEGENLADGQHIALEEAGIGKDIMEHRVAVYPGDRRPRLDGQAVRMESVILDGDRHLSREHVGGGRTGALGAGTGLPLAPGECREEDQDRQSSKDDRPGCGCSSHAFVLSRIPPRRTPSGGAGGLWDGRKNPRGAGGGAFSQR